MRRYILCAMVAGGAVATIALMVVASGIVPVKASSGHWGVTEWFLRFALQRSIATHSLGVVPPRLDDPALLVKGARHYEAGCRSCHGTPDLGPPRMVRGMLPHPPDLPPRIEASSPEKLFYVVKHGIKFTGMPAWPSQKRDDEVWAMVAFLLKLPELDEAGYRRLAGGESTPGETSHEHTAALRVAVSTMQSCARCHADRGRDTGGGAFPKLAGQRSEYLENALHAYASGRRHSGFMEPAAAGLGAEEIRELAHYYSSAEATTQPLPVAPVSPASTVLIDRGRAIALNGIADQRVPSCVECHGPGARRGKSAYPLLAGQPAAYLQLQLQRFRDDQRGGSMYAHLMRPIAARLTEGQMREVALYFESLGDAKNLPSGTRQDGRFP